MKNIEVLILDFDGVLCDSREECLQLSLKCFLEVCDKDILDKINIPLTTAKEVFRSRRGYVRPAQNFFLLWSWITTFPEKKLDINQFEALSLDYKKQLRDFEILFFATRRKMISERPNEFVKLNPLYDGAKELLSTLKIPVYIVSTKDEDSISLLLKSNGVEVNKVFGFGSQSKAECVLSIISSESSQPDRTAFIDDNPAHLDDVDKVGVNTFWASWGYGPEDLVHNRKLSSLEEINTMILIDNGD